MTTVFDAAGKGSAKACWALMRRARADRFGSASSAAKPSTFQEGASCKIKKPDMYWSVPRDAERPVISVVKIGYVRRSEFGAKPHWKGLITTAVVIHAVILIQATVRRRTQFRRYYLG